MHFLEVWNPAQTSLKQEIRILAIGGHQSGSRYRRNACTRFITVVANSQVSSPNFATIRFNDFILFFHSNPVIFLIQIYSKWNDSLIVSEVNLVVPMLFSIILPHETHWEGDKRGSLRGRKHRMSKESGLHKGHNQWALKKWGTPS